ncbi:MAG: ABC transporter ATP-binding protein [Actinomycetota bacterium]
MAGTLTLDIERRFANGPLIAGELSIPVEVPEVTVLFGPSGSGKTTILRCIAGLERPDAGRVAYGSEVWSDAGTGAWVKPQNRRVGLLHQDYALFPQRTVAGNVGYGLRRQPSPQRDARVEDLLQRFGLSELSGRSARKLSGGQQQRAALARALAPNPRLLLLDEPLSALDAPTRESLGIELRSLLTRSAIPSILVTHDRSEALSLGDRMAVVIDGRIRQVGPVEEVFSRPADPEIAQAVGVENVLPARVAGRGEGVLYIEAAGRRLSAVDTGIDADNVLACIRAEEVILRRGDDSADSARNHIPATVVEVVRTGPLFRVVLDCGFSLAALVTVQARDELELAPGAPITALIKAPSIHCVPRPTVPELR